MTICDLMGLWPTYLDPVPTGMPELSISAWVGSTWQYRTSALNSKATSRWHERMGDGYQRELCSIHITFEKNIALFRQVKRLHWWCAEWLTELLSYAVAEAPVSQQQWKSRVKGQTGGETRKHPESDCWGGEAGWVCADSTEHPAQHDVKKMLSCGFVWNKHRSKCCEGYRRSMRDEGASLESSPLQKPGSSMGRLSCF